MATGTVNRFRMARGRLLARQIDTLADRLGRKLEVLDVGGRETYWANVPTQNLRRVVVLNPSLDDAEPVGDPALFHYVAGDGRDLSGFADQSIDLVHSNSVIEHVGSWSDMQAMAGEVRRVGRSGWIQTPAWEFPVEPHFRLPFVHWMGQPMRRRLIALVPPYRGMSLSERRFYVDLSNLLSLPEFRALFPDCAVHVERVIFRKSYTARWMPDGTPLT